MAKEIISGTEHLCLLSASNIQKDIAEGRLSTISIEGANLNRPVGCPSSEHLAQIGA
jgi:hypothetical protein